jgi:hypothetical protein
MPTRPITAHCRRCGDSFHLYEIAEAGHGTCPRCNRILSDDWTMVLREESARAEVAMRDLVGALRRLRTIPSNAAVSPQSVLRNLFEEVGWQRDIESDPLRYAAEVAAIDELLAGWRQRVASGARRDPSLRRRRIAPWRTQRAVGTSTKQRTAIPSRASGSAHRVATLVHELDAERLMPRVRRGRKDAA